MNVFIKSSCDYKYPKTDNPPLGFWFLPVRFGPLWSSPDAARRVLALIFCHARIATHNGPQAEPGPISRSLAGPEAILARTYEIL